MTTQDARIIAALLVLSLSGCDLMLSMEEQKTVAGVCEGTAIAGAKAHEKKGDGFAVFVQEKAETPYEWSVDGVHWKLKQPTKIEKVNTVFCLGAPQEVPRGECAFQTSEGIGVVGVQVVETGRSEGPTFPRFGAQRTARLVDPSTAETIAEHTIVADAPKCDQFVGDPVAENFRALTPSPISFAEWATGQLGIEK